MAFGVSISKVSVRAQLAHVDADRPRVERDLRDVLVQVGDREVAVLVDAQCGGAHAELRPGSRVCRQSIADGERKIEGGLLRCAGVGGPHGDLALNVTYSRDATRRVHFRSVIRFLGQAGTGDDQSERKCRCTQTPHALKSTRQALIQPERKNSCVLGSRPRQKTGGNMSAHSATVVWERPPGVTFKDNKYSRAHEWRFDGGTVVQASSSPSVVPLPMSRQDAVDPEEAFVASLSSCHMLFFLFYAAKAGFVVDHYEDDAVGETGKNSTGAVAMLRVRLRPRNLG